MLPLPTDSLNCKNSDSPICCLWENGIYFNIIYQILNGSALDSKDIQVRGPNNYSPPRIIRVPKCN